MKTQADYWNKKIKIWSDSSYQRRGEQNFIEWLAGFFRGPITGRMRVTLKVVGPLVKGKTIIDLGCGVGDFCFHVLEYKPKKIIGIDISSIAIQEAKKRAKQKGVEDKINFLQGDAGLLTELPEFDFVVGQGFIDYLNKEELTHLFKQFENRCFFFSFPEKKFSLVNLLQQIYLKTQHCPGAYKYSRQEMSEILPKDLAFYFVIRDKMVFVTNLPR